MVTEQTSFRSGAERCAAWLTLPDGEGPHPVVVLAHGGGATHEMMLDRYEAALSQAGLAVLAFDYRHFGQSDGRPRQLFSLRRQLQDVDAALAFARSHPELDGTRVALWGTSFAGSHVVTAAARHPELAAAVVQCPVLKGRAPALASGWRSLARLTWPICSDILRSLSRRPRRYVQLVGRPGELAFVTAPGALEGWHSVCPEGFDFDNRVTAGVGISMLLYDAAASAHKVRCPLLVCVSDNENLMDPAIASRVAERAPRGIALHYPADHFEVYHPPLFEQIVTDQIRFLRTYLLGAHADAPTGSADGPAGDREAMRHPDLRQETAHPQ
jgi:Dipeptidyl aminopeptidases/acylaminoacyl-peptidases